MRWFLGLVLVVALVVGVAYGVGFFFLSNTLEVSRSVDIERPRASVFAMINDLRIAKEWSPYYARDPGAQFEISDTPGPGQSMRWFSDRRDVGSGRMQIEQSVENESVQGTLAIGDQIVLDTEFALTPIDGGTRVAWTVRGNCPSDWSNVPCRLISLVRRADMRRSLDEGLRRLEGLAEQLPEADFEGLNPQNVETQGQNFVFCVANTSMQPEEFERQQQLCLTSVRTYMAAENLQADGPLVRVTTAYDPSAGRIEFRVGYRFQGPPPVNFSVAQVGRTPEGRMLRVIHEGPRAAVRTTYARIEAYLQAHRINAGLPWEIVLHESGLGDPTPTRIEIYRPLLAAEGR